MGDAGLSRRCTYQAVAICIATFMMLCAIMTGASTSAMAEGRIALVIGNGKYARDPLPNPPRDAALIADTLRRVGFNVIEVIDADRQAMRNALISFSRKLAEADSIGLFYYAGHGVQVSGDNYLLPIDVDIRTEAEVLLQGINLNEILATLRPTSNRLAVAVLDACRNNPFVGLTRGLSRGLAPVTAPAGTLIAFSTAPGEVALDGDGQNSPYTAAIARAIPVPGLAIEEVFKRARQDVMSATANAQVPWEHSSLTGRFVFVPKTNVSPDSRDSIAGRMPDDRLAEIAEWERIKRAIEPASFKVFLKKFPSGAFSELARYKLEQYEQRHNTWTWWLPKVATATRPIGVSRTQAEELFERALGFEAEQKSQEDLKHARTLYEAAAEAGLAPAMYRLGRMLEHSARRDRKIGTSNKAAYESELAEAAKWYAKGAEKSHPAAQRALGTLHEFGEGVRQDLVEALRLYKSAAEAGDAGGMTSLGFLYGTGKGVNRKPLKARNWYARAANAGSERAMFNFAIMLMSEDGGAVNVPEAAKWLKAAAAKGHPGAMRQLAALYDEGRGVPRDSISAADYLLKAYAAGNQAAKSDLHRHYRRWSRATRRAIQRHLRSAKLYPGAVHGTFNSSTRRALTQYAKLQ
jgi:TPR repeat protein